MNVCGVSLEYTTIRLRDGCSCTPRTTVAESGAGLIHRADVASVSYYFSHIITLDRYYIYYIFTICEETTNSSYSIALQLLVKISVTA